MAWIFMLAIECGTSESDTIACKAHFEHFEVQNADSYWAFEVDLHRLEDEGSLVHWIVVYSKQLPWRGVQDSADAAILSRAGNVLLAHLKSFTQFRFAIVGVESLEAIQYSALNERLLIDSRFLAAFAGLVISNEIFAKIIIKQPFARFSDQHVWIPYLGEKAPSSQS